jgi:hypothetical protein
MTMKNTTAVAAAVLVSLLHAGAAHALDLTGTWTGTEKCKLFTSAAFTNKGTVTVQISQSGTDLNATFTGNYLSGTYNGVALASMSDANAGQAGLIGCSNSPSYGFSGRFTVKTDGVSEGQLKGSITVIDTGFMAGVATCKYSLKRTSAADPVVGSCPP